MKNCIVCGKEFEPSNPKGVFCSGACKMKASRQKAKDALLAEIPELKIAAEVPVKQPIKERVISVDEPIRKSDLCNIQFSKYLKEFEAIVKAGSSRGKIADLKTRAANDNIINLRQKEAVIARCENVLNGTYGNTKTAEHLKHSGLLTTK